MKRLPVVLLLLASCSPSAPPSDPSAAWLVARQSEDGAWRSEVYDNVLGRGYALTPFVLLSIAEEKDVAPSVFARGIAFVRAHSGQTEEYPTYAAALSILALARFRPAGWETDAAGLARFLRERQLAEPLGWELLDVEYGGWDYGAVLPKKPNSQRPEISTTAFAVEALRAAGATADDPAIQKAVRFTLNCRNPDGGYFFTPQKLIGHHNKAGPEGTTFRSYATTTCDAIRSLRAAGVEDSDVRIAAALEWLKKNSPIDRPGGFPEDVPTAKDWADALIYYYYYVLALVRPSPDLRDQVLSLRRRDGSWVNEHGLMKEDDPIMVTALSLLALSRCPKEK